MTGGSESWLSLVFKFVNFAVLLGLLIKFAGKPLKEYFANRHKAVKDKLDEAEKRIKEAQAIKAEYESRLAALDVEIEAFKKTIMEEAEKEKQKMVDEATHFVSKLKEQAMLTYEQEIKEVRDRIKEDIARLTIERAEKLVKERLTKEDHHKMVEAFIENMRSLN